MKRLLYLSIIIIVFGALLALDLANRGLAWQFAWWVSGEETPIAQARGVVEWAVSWTRPQPRTAALTPVRHTNVNPYGINTFLHMEVERDKVEAQLQMITAAGFTWIREQFPWEDLEVDGRGQFTDSRNDVTGDGVPDTISSWDKYDRLVSLAEQYGVQIQARLDNPPAWSHAQNPGIGAFAPPDDLQDFVNYAVAVAERYKGRIRYYQVWNEPNIYPEWGEQAVNPEAYTELLCRTYDALKAVDPEIVVISGALAPTISLTGRDLSDTIFLQRMYQAGAGECFDILSMQGYGLNSGPTDRRMRPTTINVAHNLYIRDLMVANGDAHKPIWITEAAWNSVPTEAEYPEPISLRTAFGQVTQQQAAAYMPRFYQRAQQEWPWVGVVNYWFFTRPSDAERNQSFYYFRMVEPDFNPDNEPPFTPLPVYDTMRTYINVQTPTLYRGVHQAAGHWAIDTAEEARVVRAEEATFGDAVETTRMTFVADGTDVVIRWRGEALTVQIDDGDAVQVDSEKSGEGWERTLLELGTLTEARTLTLTSETPVTVESITVLDRTYQKVVPLLTIALVGGIMLVLSVMVGIRSRNMI
ncbi:MAG: hypothetical protein OHK0046_35460 [Anaerolineae bacterium]